MLKHREVCGGMLRRLTTTSNFQGLTRSSFDIFESRELLVVFSRRVCWCLDRFVFLQHVKLDTLVTREVDITYQPALSRSAYCLIAARQRVLASTVSIFFHAWLHAHQATHAKCYSLGLLKLSCIACSIAVLRKGGQGCGRSSWRTASFLRMD